MARDQAGSQGKISCSELEALPPEPSDATTIRVFRHVAAFYEQQAHVALAGMYLNIGRSFLDVGTNLHRSAAAIETAALSDLPLSAADLDLLGETRTAVERVLRRFKHDALRACLGELERRQARGSEPTGRQAATNDPARSTQHHDPAVSQR